MNPLELEVERLSKLAVAPEPVFRITRSWASYYVTCDQTITIEDKSYLAPMVAGYMKTEYNLHTNQMKISANVGYIADQSFSAMMRLILTVVSSQVPNKKKREDKLIAWIQSSMDYRRAKNNAALIVDMMAIYKWLASDGFFDNDDNSKQAAMLLRAVAVKHGAQL